MTLLLFLCATAAWAVLQHQQRRHAAELARECARHGIPVGEPSPAVPVLESVLTVLAGLALVLPAAAVLAGAFAHGDPAIWNHLWRSAAVGLAAGTALLILGTRSLLWLRKCSAP